MTITFENIIKFWFEELTSAQWFKVSQSLDLEIKERFLDTHTKATNNELIHWRQTPEGRMAEIIVLDQFSRNIFRGQAEAFAQDPLALKLAREAVKVGADKEIPIEKRSFLYMPYMHSETLDAHTEALKLFDSPGMEGSLNFEIKHKNIIDRFQRYPHRNKILERESTMEEIEFLKQPGSSF